MTFFSVFGLPKGQPRVKAFRRGNHAGVYDPGTADVWKMQVAAEARNHVPPQAMTGAMECRLVFRMPRPKAHFRANGELKPTAPVAHTSKPDSDNLAKAVLDALTETRIFWQDDAQVSSLTVDKVYGPETGCAILIAEYGRKQP